MFHVTAAAIDTQQSLLLMAKIMHMKSATVVVIGRSKSVHCKSFFVCSE